VETFNDEEIQEWKSELQKGLKDNDWLDLVTHCTHHFVSGGQITFERYDSENEKTRCIGSSRDRVSSQGQPLNYDLTFSNRREEQTYRLNSMFLRPHRGEDVDKFDQSFKLSITDDTLKFKKYEEIHKRSLQRSKLGG
jgi:hypothetical protein